MKYIWWKYLTILHDVMSIVYCVRGWWLLLINTVVFCNILNSLFLPVQNGKVHICHFFVNIFYFEAELYFLQVWLELSFTSDLWKVGGTLGAGDFILFIFFASHQHFIITRLARYKKKKMLCP